MHIRNVFKEKEFLKNYTVPFVQLEPKKTILVFSHRHNTFDKKKLLETPDNHVQKVSSKTVDDFIKDEDYKDFYMNRIENLLLNYSPGEPEMKPDVIKQIKEIEAERKRRHEELVKANSGQITINKDGNNIPLNNHQIVTILQEQNTKLQEISKTLDEKNKEIVNLNIRNESLSKQEEINSYNLKQLLGILIEKDKEIKELREEIKASFSKSLHKM